MWWTKYLAVYMYLIYYYHACGLYNVWNNLTLLLIITILKWRFHSYCSKLLTMDPEYSLHDVIRCHLCESPGPPLHCVMCRKYLCKYCKEKHLSDEFKEHKVMPLKFISKCKNISQKYVIFSANVVAFHFVWSVFFLGRIMIMTLLT